MDLQTALTWLFMDKFLSSVTPRIFIWSAKGIWEPATLTVARLEWNYHVACEIQEAQLSPSDRAMRLVGRNLVNYHATVQKLLIRQVLAKPVVWSWRFSWRQCVKNMCTQPWRDWVALIVSGVINKPTTDELCISPVYRRLAVVKFSKSTM